MPYDPQALGQGELKFINPEETGARLRLPTANIWGRNDTTLPLPARSEGLCAVCEDLNKNAYIHNEGHDIPGPRAQEAVQGSVRAIRRAIDQALRLQ